MEACRQRHSERRFIKPQEGRTPRNISCGKSNRAINNSSSRFALPRRAAFTAPSPSTTRSPSFLAFFPFSSSSFTLSLSFPFSFFLSSFWPPRRRPFRSGTSTRARMLHRHDAARDGPQLAPTAADRGPGNARSPRCRLSGGGGDRVESAPRIGTPLINEQQRASQRGNEACVTLSGPRAYLRTTRFGARARRPALQRRRGWPVSGPAELETKRATTPKRNKVPAGLEWS